MPKKTPMTKGGFVRSFWFIGGAVFVVAILFVGYIVGPSLFSYEYDQHADTASSTVASSEEVTPPLSEVQHLATPDPLKAIYMSQCVVGTPSFRDKLVDLIDTTELNAVIIDIKDYSGKIGFSTDNPALSPYVSDACGTSDIESFIKELHAKGIYVIGRITVFQDPYYSKMHPELAVKKASDGSVWKDHKGLSFIDVGARPYWDYVIELGRESYGKGFDELNFDYIRYPSDGDMKDIAFTLSEGKPKYEEVETFFSYLYEAFATGEKPTSGLRPAGRVVPSNIDRPVLSADLFGYTTTNSDDLGIGQVLERALPYFDYVMPMVYPSHYNNGFLGIAKPATEPYKVVNYSMESAVRRAKILSLADATTSTSTDMVFLKQESQKGHGNISMHQLRPWLQDFDLGATYTADMVRAQMQATYDAGLTSWALWDAGNTYTKSALESELAR